MHRIINVTLVRSRPPFIITIHVLAMCECIILYDYCVQFEHQKASPLIGCLARLLKCATYSGIRLCALYDPSLCTFVYSYIPLKYIHSFQNDSFTGFSLTGQTVMKMYGRTCRRIHDV